MSKDWGLHCKQCDQYSVDFNHGQILLREVIGAWPHIKALIEIPTLRYVEVTLMAHQYNASDLFSFLQEHGEHPLELSSEYGDTEPIEETPHGIAYRARTPEQKREVIERLLALWEQYPDLRLGQLITNAYRDCYHVEDMDFIEALERFYAGVRGKR